jgi:hypothetical protein
MCRNGFYNHLTSETVKGIDLRKPLNLYVFSVLSWSLKVVDLIDNLSFDSGKESIKIESVPFKMANSFLT